MLIPRYKTLIMLFSLLFPSVAFDCVALKNAKCGERFGIRSNNRTNKPIHWSKLFIKEIKIQANFLAGQTRLTLNADAVA